MGKRGYSSDDCVLSREINVSLIAQIRDERDRGRCDKKAINPLMHGVRRAVIIQMDDLMAAVRASLALERRDVLLADAVDQKDQPVDRLTLRGGKVRAPGKRHRDLAKLRPAPVEIDQVARRLFAPAA